MAETDELTVEQAARELGVQSKAVRAAIGRNAFPNLRRGPKDKLPNIFIPRSDVENYKRTRRRTRTRRRSPAAPAAATRSRPTQTQLLWSPPERVGLLRAALDVEEAPEDRKRIAALLRQVADLLER
jgi:hypothetical protein